MAAKTNLKFDIFLSKRIEGHLGSCNKLEDKTPGNVFFHEGALASSVQNSTYVSAPLSNGDDPSTGRLKVNSILIHVPSHRIQCWRRGRNG